jgi:glycosyltransferase involved in cell wall biosynthesis
MSAERKPSHRCYGRWFGGELDGHAKLAFVGRFSPEKGLEDFLEIADRLAERIPVRVAIAGGVPSHPMVRGWLASRPWAQAHGVLQRPQVAELLAAADVVVCPSRTTRFAEQFGKVPVEAMAVGTPVFAFDCGALREVIGSGGVVVEEGAGHALVDELERYFRASESARVELAERARAQASHFTDAALAEALIQLWSELLAEDPSAAGLA